ncbi:ring-cleaving dioxygenase [Carnobacterium divergens]|uniref:ring-cleaving dioxygenase n=1 Tax=Carnobacterium divergens TaxID=2748 RepID=UPI000E767009|nr:ring-cleaving dioxygenase [Carnobacterium divergens]AOA00546.1 glyoxalase [Carnobacterium divergens]MDT2012463.1 ring-cleaving dioxygenase [Carnobacterium divergens]TFJ41206.1 ring-cleaving dioxygenase [Carnobacterium divergens]TFJ49845.1 ring-cleaving dioxygenase [Carnobacterium divergens]TFJ55130.1 ring-cleaving dioxygenase [Carnobacterium divergens]
MNELKGIHHVTAMTSSAEKNYHFFTEVLGMRLVKKTVNQDDIQTYHTFFADDRGSAGTDMTFFDFPGIPKGTKGTNSISKTSFRVPSDKALDYWLERFDQHNVTHTGLTSQFGNKSIQFVDFDGQQYQLISDEHNPGVPAGIPWQKGPVPYDYAIVGLGPIFLTVSSLDAMRLMLVEVMKMNEIAQEENAYLFEVGEGGNGGQVIVEHRDDLPQAMEGFGNVHHVAFRVEDRAALEAWISRIQDYSLPQSGYVDRFYFESLYVRVGPHILFEFATDGPGFMQDEPYETMGEKLSLPPFLEAERAEIERMVRPFDTTRRD